jgi:hypothetical protein
MKLPLLELHAKIFPDLDPASKNELDIVKEIIGDIALIV